VIILAEAVQIGINGLDVPRHVVPLGSQSVITQAVTPWVHNVPRKLRDGLARVVRSLHEP
jgi:hypothetical protein